MDLMNEDCIYCVGIDLKMYIKAYRKPMRPRLVKFGYVSLLPDRGRHAEASGLGFATLF